jgi:hypothetical protein
LVEECAVSLAFNLSLSQGYHNSNKQLRHDDGCVTPKDGNLLGKRAEVLGGGGDCRRFARLLSIFDINLQTRRKVP